MRLVSRLVLLMVGLLLAPAASAHILTEAPWDPLARAYRTTVFLLNLQPTDWALIEQTLTTDAAKRLQQLDEATGSGHGMGVEIALAERDAAALFGATTRAVSQAVRHHLDQAANQLQDPGAAAREVAAAERLYRSFASFIQQTDPEGFRALGLAWLDLASSVGHAGVVEVGARAADEVEFASARATIGNYLIANYEPDGFAPRRRYAPVPEQRFLANPDLEIQPWLPPGSDLNDQDPLPRLVLNFEQQGIDERDLFLAAYGDMLFDSPEIFGEPARSLGLACATCHNRSDVNQRFFIPGISPQAGAVDVDGSFFNARFNDHRADALDIPSLRGLRFTGPYGNDGRFASLRDFTRNVIVNEFAGAEPDPQVLDALVAYMLEFDFLPAPQLDADGRLNDTASTAAKRGEALFNRPFEQMGERSCASCHVPDSHFTDNRVHDIGSSGSDGRFSGARDTPTLLNIVHNAPYFHDGSLSTLAEVVTWFDERFGLGLSAAEQGDLTAYLEAVGTGEEPYEQFDAEFTPFRLMVEELSTFLSTLDTLIAERDRVGADLLLRTVATDFAVDASAMTNRTAVGKVDELVERLWQLRDVINAEEWDQAAHLWAGYRELEQQYDAELH